MIQLENLTLPRLLHYVEGHAARLAAGRQSLPARAFAADATGRVTVFGFPAPAGDEDRQALSAILEAEMSRRRATMSVLLLQTQAEPSAGPAECVVLEGRQIRPWPRREIRFLSIERQGRKIAALRRISPPVRMGAEAVDLMYRA